MDYFQAIAIFQVERKNYKLSAAEIGFVSVLIECWNAAFRRDNFKVNNSFLRNELNISQDTLSRYQKRLHSINFIDVAGGLKEVNVSYCLNFLKTDAAKIGINTANCGISEKTDTANCGTHTAKIGIDTANCGIYTKNKEYKETTTTTNAKIENFETPLFGNSDVEVEVEKEKSSAKKEKENWRNLEQWKSSFRYQVSSQKSKFPESEIETAFDDFFQNSDNENLDTCAKINAEFTKYQNARKFAKVDTENESDHVRSNSESVAEIKAWFHANPDDWTNCRDMAQWNEGKDGTALEEIIAYVHWNAENKGFAFMTNPTKSLPHHFARWLKRAKEYNAKKVIPSQSKNYINGSKQFNSKTARNGHSYDVEQSELALQRAKELCNSAKQSRTMADTQSERRI